MKTKANKLVLPGLACLVAIVLFEPLFLNASLLSVDNRIIPPFIVNAPEGVRPMNVDSVDINAFIMPEAIRSVDRWKAGEAPLWNDGEALGLPLHAGMGFVSFYPTAPLYFLVDPLRAYAVSLALHLVFLGMGTYLLFTRKGLPTLPAMFGAVLVIFCGFLTARFHLACVVQAAAWYPWILLVSDSLVDRPTFRRAGVLALLVGFSLLGGFPQVAMFGLYVSAVAFLIAWYCRSRRARPLLLGGLAACLGGLLSAVVMLPGLEFLSESTRETVMSRERASVKSLEPAAAAGAVLPRFFGDPVQDIDFQNPVPRSLASFPTHALTTPDSQNVFTENTFYMGCIALVLMALGSGRFHLVVAVVALGIAFGVPLLVDAARFLPGISTGIPKRALWIASFSLAWLAASGVAAIMRSPGRRHLILVASGIFFLFLGTLSLFPFESWFLQGGEDAAWFRESVVEDLRRVGLAGVVLLVSALLLKYSAPLLASALLIVGGTAEVATFARAVNPPQDLEGQYDTTPAIEWLQERKDCRIFSFLSSGVMPGSIAHVYGIRSLNGYMPFTQQRTGELLRALDPQIIQVDGRVIGGLGDAALLDSPLLDLFGVRYVACGLQGHRILQEKSLPLCYLNKEESLAIYERKTALPLAFMVERILQVEDGDARLEMLVSNDPLVTAIVEEVPGGSFVRGEAVYSRPSPERIEVEVNCPGPGFLVVSEAHYPGWEASVDGEEVQLVRTDHALMGVVIPEGARRVEIVYRPASFKVGVILSCAGLLGCVFLFCCRGSKK